MKRIGVFSAFFFFVGFVMIHHKAFSKFPIIKIHKEIFDYVPQKMRNLLVVYDVEKTLISSDGVPVEKQIAFFLRNMQKICCCMALTARPSSALCNTIQQLQEADIIFEHVPSKRDSTFFSKRLHSACAYAQGVLCCSDGDKGDALVTFLEIVGLKPDHIIFVDDTVKHLKNMDHALAKASIPSTCINYMGFLDENCMMSF